MDICQQDTDDLISRSALLKEIGDPDDGMTWPTKHGIVSLIENAPAIKYSNNQKTEVHDNA